MKILWLLLFVFSVNLFAQSNRFLSLDVEKLRTTKRIKFYVQDKIILKIKNDPHKYKGTIMLLNDTVLILDSTKLIFYKDIRKVLVDRSNSLTRVASTFISGCGVGYIALDALNNAINNNKPILRILDVEIGVSLLAIGQAFRIFAIKHYKINKKHTLKFIDDTP